MIDPDGLWPNEALDGEPDARGGETPCRRRGSLLVPCLASGHPLTPHPFVPKGHPTVWIGKLKQSTWSLTALTKYSVPQYKLMHYALPRQAQSCLAPTQGGGTVRIRIGIWTIGSKRDRLSIGGGIRLPEKQVLGWKIFNLPFRNLSFASRVVS